MTTQELYRCAARNHIPIVTYPMPRCGSMSVETPCGSAIGVDRRVLRSTSQTRTHLAHELGHCLTGSFYNRYTPYDVRLRHEHRADKWAIRKLIPAKALDEAVAAGHTQLWELAEHFGVTEDFMRKAVCLHVHGNLATDLYF